MTLLRLLHLIIATIEWSAMEIGHYSPPQQLTVLKWSFLFVPQSAAIFHQQSTLPLFNPVNEKEYTIYIPKMQKVLSGKLCGKQNTSGYGHVFAYKNILRIPFFFILVLQTGHSFLMSVECWAQVLQRTCPQFSPMSDSPWLLSCNKRNRLEQHNTNQKRTLQISKYLSIGF